MLLEALFCNEGFVYYLYYFFRWMEWRWPCCKGGWGYTRAQCVFTYANYLRHEGWLLEWRQHSSGDPLHWSWGWEGWWDKGSCNTGRWGWRASLHQHWLGSWCAYLPFCLEECRQEGWWWWQQEDPTRCPGQQDPHTGKAWGGDQTKGQLGEKRGFSRKGDHQWRSFQTNTLFWKDDGAGMEYWWKRTNDGPSRRLGGDQGASGNAEQKCDCDGSHSSSSANPHPIRMMIARLDDSLKNLNHGWTTSEKDMVNHISNQFLDPTQLDGRNSMRATLVQSADGGWSMAEYCADMTKLVVLEKVMRPVITILTRDSMVPEDMGFILEDEFDFNPQQGNDEAEAAAIPVAPDENEMEQRRMRMVREEMIGLEIWW